MELHTQRIDIAWRPAAGWRFDFRRAWGGRVFGCQCGYLWVSVWRKG